MQLDMRTIVFSFLIINLLCTGIIGLLWQQNRRQLNGLGLWLASYSIQLIGVALVGLRDIAPDFASAVIGNSLAVVSAILLYMGLESYVGKRSRQVHNFIFLAVFMLIQTYFTLVQPSQSARNINISAAFVFIYTQCAWLLLARVDPARRSETRGVGLILIIYCLVSLVRISSNAFLGSPGENFLQETIWFETLSLLMAQVLYIALTFGLLLMVNRRLNTAHQAEIAVRAQAEEALQHSEERYRGIVKHANDGIALISPEGRVIEWNPALENITGIPAGQALGGFIWEVQAPLMSPDRHTPQTMQALKVFSLEALRLGETSRLNRSFEWPFHRLDGALRYAGQSVYSIRAAGGFLLCSTIRDITEQKMAEAALHEYAVEQELLLSVTSVAAAWLDQDELLTRILEVLTARLQPAIAWIYVEDPFPNLAASRPLSPGARQQLIDFHRRRQACAAESKAVHLNDAGLLNLLREPLLQAELGLASDSPPSPASACIPLRAGERLLGRLSLVWRSANPLSDKTQATLAAVGRQVAIALRNTALIQTARQVDRLQTLNQINAAITSSLDRTLVLEKILQTISQATGAGRASILRLIPETGELIFEATLTAETAVLVGKKLAPGVGIVGWIIQHQQSVNIPDVQLDRRYFSAFETLTGLAVHSMIGVPLLYNGNIKGIILLTNKSQGEFSSDDLALVEAAAAIAAVALENARLFDAARSRAEEMQAIHTLSQSMTASLDSAASVDATLNRLQTLLDADFAGYFPVDPLTGHPAIGATRGVPIQVYYESAELPQSSISDWLIQNRSAFRIDCAGEDERMRMWTERFPEIGQASLMFAPLLEKAAGAEEGAAPVEPVEQAAVKGSLCVIRFRPIPYTPDDLRLLESVAAMLNVALKNAQLYEDLRRALEERERTQHQLIQSEKVSALGQLAASLAHEINNPLQAVKGCLSLFEEEMEGSQDQNKLDQYMRIVRSEIERVVILVRGMREFYRPSRQPVQPVDIHALLENLLALSARQLSIAAIETHTHLAPVALHVSANPDHLKQVFMNLILNAADAMQSGGTLSISTSLARPAGPHARPGVVIQVSDTGHGMSPEVLEHLFEPFFTTKEQGSGLGLYVSYGIIQSYGGKLSVSSQVKEGATFTITLPSL